MGLTANAFELDRYIGAREMSWIPATGPIVATHATSLSEGQFCSSGVIRVPIPYISVLPHYHTLYS